MNTKLIIIKRMQLYDLLKPMRIIYVLFVFQTIKLKSFSKLNIS